MVVGHESSGIVVKAGKNVTHLQENDPVALEPGVPCGQCDQCRTGKYNLCPDIRFFATPPIDGSMARYIAHPGKLCFKIPDSLTLEHGAMCEPLSVGVYACEQKAKVTAGSSVVIFGAGPIGTLCAMVSRGMGAKKVIVCDILASRLEFLKKLIPESTLATVDTTGMSVEDVAAKVKIINGGYCDGAIDCAGVESAISAAILCTRNGGSVCLVGMGKPLATLPILNASIREVDLLGVFRYRHTYPQCLELLASGKVDVMPLITHRFQFTQESIMDAFETCRTGRDGAIKCMIHIGDVRNEKNAPYIY
eukprot:GEMP01045056.1.p1 GENE.GEMP01045056.1~~GEMP01045056.1.p1  ORF type:complete len:307 (+),score=51.17 GEMP01045056.1:212-1132(+)